MKQILIPLLLLVAIVGKGQRDTTKTVIDYMVLGTVGHPITEIQHRDTVACLFLVTDTAHLIVGHGFQTGTAIRFGQILSAGELKYDTIDYGSILIKGYAVEEQRRDLDSGLAWIELVDYLDEHKKPLPSTYIIWQTRPVVKKKYTNLNNE